MLGIMMMEQVRPRGVVVCRVCQKHEVIEADTCGELVRDWKAHPWYRKAQKGHVCPSCMGEVEA